MRSAVKLGPGLFVVVLLAILLTGGPALVQPATVGELKRSFENPPGDARIMVRWWWFGPAVNKAELEREMRLMKKGGIGGFEVQPVYPLTLGGNLTYLSPEFLEALRFTGAKARELGLRMDLTLGSGWPYGGPHVPIAKAASRLRVERGAGALKLGDVETLLARVGDLSFIVSHTRQTVKRAASLCWMPSRTLRRRQSLETASKCITPIGP